MSVGVCIGAGCSLSVVKALLEGLVQEIPEEKTEIYRSLLQQLGNLGGQQIRNVAVRMSHLFLSFTNSFVAWSQMVAWFVRSCQHLWSLLAI